ncbi:MAG: CHAD domain-containing protein [Methanosarcinaceae archaeon]|nr:CHAD domain-containing protein [Methanosarcinaceae archaeon]
MEIEAKFLIKDKDSFRELEVLDRLGAYTLSVGKLQRIEDTFQDTEDREITASGYYLRLRKTLGEKGHWVTIKSLDGFEDGRHKREEYVGFLPAGVPLIECPEASVRNRIIEMVGAAELRPLIKLKQERLFRQVETGGRHVAELALDRVKLKSEAREQSYLELEVELKEGGTEEDLNLISDFLHRTFRLESGSYSKFERALLFREGLEENAVLSLGERAFCNQLEPHRNVYGKWARILLAHDRGLSGAEISLCQKVPEPEIRALISKFGEERLSIFPFVRNESAARKIHFQPHGEVPGLKKTETTGGGEEKEKEKEGKGGVESPECLLELYAADKEKALRVKALALELFDGFFPYHGLGAEDKKLLELAALLNDIGSSVSKKGRARFGKEIVLVRPPGGLEPRTLRLLALVLDLQAPGISEKNLKKVLEESNIKLSPGFQNRALVLAAFIRIAALLEDEGENGKPESPVRLGNILELEEGLEIELSGAGAGKAVKRIEKIKKIWERLFETKLRFIPVKKSYESKIEEDSDSENEVKGKEVEKSGGKITLSKKVTIRSEDSMAEVARRIFSYQLGKMVSFEKGVRKGDDIEELHDMRVAIRKMRASSEIFKDYLDFKELKPHLKGLRSTLRVLGSVRDLDVFEDKAKHYLEGLPPGQEQALDPLFESLEKEREKVRKAMLAYLGSEKYTRFKEEFKDFLAVPGAGRLPTGTEKHDALPHRVKDVLPSVVYSRFAEISAYAEWVEGPYVSVERLHRLRIAAKGFRYTFEFFEPVLGEEAKSTIKEFKSLQGLLGDLHDAVVAIELLNSYLRTGAWAEDPLPPLSFSENERENRKRVIKGMEGVEAYLEYREKELNFLLDSFPEAWAKVRSREFRQRIEKALENLY